MTTRTLPLAAALLALLLACYINPTISASGAGMNKGKQEAAAKLIVEAKKRGLKGKAGDKKLAKQKIKNLKSANQAPMKRRFRKKKSLASVLFPGVAPEEYSDQQEVSNTDSLLLFSVRSLSILTS